MQVREKVEDKELFNQILYGSAKSKREKHWPTPTVSDTFNNGAKETARRKAEGNPFQPSGARIGSSLKDHVLEKRLWPTPTARDFRDGGSNIPGKTDVLGQRVLEDNRIGLPDHQNNLTQSHSVWIGTPRASMRTRTAEWRGNREIDLPAEYAEKKAKEMGGWRLSTIFVAWLMGFPIGWAHLKDTEMPLSRRLDTLSDEQ